MTKPSKAARQVLRETIQLLRKGWSKGSWARNSEGRRVTPTSPSAVCWCPEGAMRKICTNRFGNFDDGLQFEAWVAFHDAVGLDKYASAAEWADQQKSLKPVLTALRKAMG